MQPAAPWRRARRPFRSFGGPIGSRGDQKYLTPILSLRARVGSRAVSDLSENVLDALDRRSTWGAEAVRKAEAGEASSFDRYLAWQSTGDKRYLETAYGDEIRAANQRMYTQTEGHWWSDRVEIPSEILQRSRLGGVGLKRNWIHAGATVGWRFDKVDGAEKVAILMPGATEPTSR